MAIFYTFCSVGNVFPSLILLLLVPYSSSIAEDGRTNTRVPSSDIDLLEFPLNLEYFEAEFFLYGSLGCGLDHAAPKLTDGGPSPVGAKKAFLDPFVKDVIEQFAWQEVGHLRAIKNTVKGFPRPLLNLSSESFATAINKAFRKPSNPPFDPYASGLHYLIASYLIPYVGLTGYFGANPELSGSVSKRLVAALLAAESGQDAVIRALLYERGKKKAYPYGITVAAFTNRIEPRNKLGKAGLKDERLVVPKTIGAESRISGNILAGDRNSVGYGRTAEQILRIIYGSGDEHVPGGFYPNGANGRIVTSYYRPKSSHHNMPLL